MALPNTFSANTLTESAKVNENFTYLENKTVAASYYGWDEENSSGLEFAFFGAVHVADNVVNVIAADTVTLTPSVINYIEADGTTGAPQAVTGGYTSGNIPLHQVLAGATAFGSGDVTDVRTWAKVGGGGTTYTAGDGLDLTGTEFSIAADGVTDAMIGNRTADPSQVPSGLVGNLTQWLSWITNRIKAITGETNWYDAPDTTLAAAATHIAASAPHAGHLKTDGTVPLTGDWDVGAVQLKNLVDATDPQGAATLNQIAIAAAGFAPRPEVRTITVAALPTNTRSSNTLTASAVGSINSVGINGIIDFAPGDRVLVNNESTGAHNGPYEFDSIGSAGAPWAMTRVPDFDVDGEATLGAYYPVREGGDASTIGGWYMGTQGSITLNTTAIKFYKDPRSDGGEANTGASLGGGDADYYKQKSGVTLQFRSPVSDNDLLTIENDGDNVRYTVEEANFDLANMGGVAGPGQGGTGISSFTLGDVIAADADGNLAAIPGNTSITRKFFAQQGDDTDSALPGWVELLPDDYPVFGQAARGAVPPGNNLGSTYFLSADGTFRLVVASPNLTGTSTTSIAIPATATGTVTFNVSQATARSWIVGTVLKITRSAVGGDNNWIIGAVDSYSHPSVTVNVLAISGSGTYSGWNVGIAVDPTLAGDVDGPASATDNALARFDSTTGKLIQNSTITLDDTGAFTLPEMAAPATPASGKLALYAKAGGVLAVKDDAGTETELGAGGSSFDSRDGWLF